MKKNYFIGMICFALVLMTGGLQAQVQLDVDGDTNIRGSLNVSKNSLPKGFSNVNNVFIELDLNHNFLSRDISQVGGVFRIDSRPNDPLFSWRRRDPGSEPLSVGDVTLMALRESGNLGIGNHNPQTKLDVNGSIRAASGNSVFVGGITSSDEDGIRLHQINSNGYIDHKGSGNLNFRVDNENGSTNRMVITSDGDVGIGTTSPNQKLDVAGNALVTDDFYIATDNLETGGIMHYGNLTRYSYGVNPIDDRSGVMLEGGSVQQSGIYLGGNYAVIWSPGNNDRLLRVYDENFAIAGAERWYVDGDGDDFKASDARLKKNVKTLTSSLEKLSQLRGVSFVWKKSDKELLGGDKETSSIGVIAQELEAVYPELVSTNEYGRKFVDYKGFTPILIEAVKEQQVMLDNKQSQIETLQSQVANLEDQFKKLENLILSGATGQNSNIPEINNSIHQQHINLTAPTLKQNQPNPFNGQTTINYFLPETTQKAQIQITDINGKVLKVETINGTGHGQLNLDAKAMPKGTYAYSLLVDGQLVETKQMILVK